MKNQDYTLVGYFSKPHGFKGQLTTVIECEDEILFDGIDHIMIEINELSTPFFIEKIDYKGKVIVKLEGINSEKEAKKLQSKKIYIHIKHIIAAEQINEDNWTGYVVIDKIKGQIGKILRTEEMPAQDVWVIDFEGKEIMLPIEPDFILGINHEEKVINYNAPEGLIDIYLS